MPNDDVLRLDGVTKRYGALTAVDDVSFAVAAGERRALIGPNGAGKTSLFNVIAGRYRATSGTIRLRGSDITRDREEVRARKGIARTFQHSSLFGTIDSVDNVVMALRRRGGRALAPLPSRRRTAGLRRRAHDVLDRVGLDPTDPRPVASLAHGQRRQLEIAMALALEPTILLFDEPTAGMSAAETEVFREVFTALPPELAVILIEHDLDVVFSLATTVTVLAAGSVISSGSPAEVQSSAAVRESYLGTNMEEVFR